MPGPAAGPKPWAGQMADSAREDAMARKLVRARVRAPLRVLLVVWGLAPPVLLFAAFWTSSPVTADNAEAYANATILGVIALAGVLQGCLYWTGSVVLSPTGRTALSRAPAEPAVHALEDAEMPVSYLEGEVWSTATGAWRRLLVRNDHPRGAVRSPLPVWGRVVRCIPKSDDRPCYLVVDDTVGDVAYKYRVTPYQFERAPLGSWVSLRVPHGRRSFSDVTVKGAGQ